MRERRAREFLRILVLLILPGCLNGTNASSKAEGRDGVVVPFVIEGFGAGTIGGYGGTILTVTNLNDDGPGSLREALNKPGPRVIRFAVAGIIRLRSDLGVSEPYLTIDGSDAPEGGITIRDATLIIGTEHVIIRHIRIRPGPGVPDPGNGDAITVKPEGKHVVLDHVSLSWSTDETFDSYGTDVTVQWSFVTEGLNCAGHPKGCHSKGLFVPEPATRVSILHTLVASHVDRNPFIRAGRSDVANQYQLINNVIYNYKGPTVIETLAPTGLVQLDFVRNYYKWGKESYRRAEIFLAPRQLATFRGTLSLYLLGNISSRRLHEGDPEDLLLREDQRHHVGTQRNFPPVVSETNAFTAFEAVLSKGGATLPCRDAVDKRVADEVRNGNGQIIDRPADVGGWPPMVCQNGKK